MELLKHINEERVRREKEFDDFINGLQNVSETMANFKEEYVSEWFSSEAPIQLPQIPAPPFQFDRFLEPSRARNSPSIDVDMEEISNRIIRSLGIPEELFQKESTPRSYSRGRRPNLIGGE